MEILHVVVNVFLVVDKYLAFISRNPWGVRNTLARLDSLGYGLLASSIISKEIIDICWFDMCVSFFKSCVI